MGQPPQKQWMPEIECRRAETGGPRRGTWDISRVGLLARIASGTTDPVAGDHGLLHDEVWLKDDHSSEACHARLPALSAGDA